MKKNAFTLIEVMIVVFLLGLVAVFIVPKINSIINENKLKICNDIVKTIEDAAESYTYKNTNIVDEEIDINGKYEITILKLQQSGLLDTNIIEPFHNSEISTSNIVIITKVDNQYIYEYQGSECK